jgi:hypothetical protein
MYEWPRFGREKLHQLLNPRVRLEDTSLMPQDRSDLKALGKALAIALFVVAGVLGLLNLNWWIILPAALACAAIGTLLLYRGPPERSASAIQTSVGRTLAVFAFSALAFIFGFTVRGQRMVVSHRVSTLEQHLLRVG